MRRSSSESERADRLVVRSGPMEGRVIRLDFIGRGLIGRSRVCRVVLKDVSVSRQHAEIERDSTDGWRIRDMSSRNGISVDGRSGADWMTLEPGSAVRVGDVKMVFEAGHDPYDQVTDPAVGVLPDEIEERAPAKRSRKRPSRSRTEDPPSLPDLEPPRPKVRTPSMRQGVRTAGVLDEDEKVSAAPHYLLGAAIGLGVALALALTLILVARMGSSDDSQPVQASAEDATKLAVVNALIANGRDASDSDDWEEAEAAWREALSLAPDHTEVQELLDLASREQRALTQISAAEAAHESGDNLEAGLLAEGVHAQSRYRQRADDLIDRIERGETATARRPAAQETKAESPPRPRRRPRRPPSRTKSTAQSASRQSAAASTAPDPILVEARRAFTQGRVLDARAGAEAAADAGVSDASALFRQLNAYHEAVQAADSALSRGESRIALAQLTEAHALARQISPPRGGNPGSETSRRLADLHYQAAREALGRDDPGTARAHLDRALGLQPNHSMARALLDRL